tara:strand:+ start:47309 stop:47626 length:318 start_codon:yes stop_codon:yes gene_type:complete
MKKQLALLTLPILAIFALAGCQTASTSGTPSDVGLTTTQLAADAKEFKDNDGYIVGIPALIVTSSAVEVGATAVGAVEATGKGLQGAGKSSKKAWDWWIHEAPKD